MQKTFIAPILILGSIFTSMGVLAKPSPDSKSLESVIESQCLREINDSRVWRNVLIMKPQQEQSAIKRSACQCVSKEAMQDSSIQRMSSVDMNDTASRDLISKVVLKSLRTCTQQILD